MATAAREATSLANYLDSVVDVLDENYFEMFTDSPANLKIKDAQQLQSFSNQITETSAMCELISKNEKVPGVLVPQVAVFVLALLSQKDILSELPEKVLLELKEYVEQEPRTGD
jgi:hypothetical protein